MRTLTLALPFLALALAPASGKTPDITGTWKVNIEKSVYPGPAPESTVYVIKDTPDGLFMKVTETRSGSSTVMDMKFDRSGKETVNQIGGMEARTVLKEDGDIMREQTVFTSDTGRMNRKSTMSVSRDGKTITFDSVVTGDRGDFKYKFVLEKQ